MISSDKGLGRRIDQFGHTTSVDG